MNPGFNSSFQNQTLHKNMLNLSKPFRPNKQSYNSHTHYQGYSLSLLYSDTFTWLLYICPCFMLSLSQGSLCFHNLISSLVVRNDVNFLSYIASISTYNHLTTTNVSSNDKIPAEKCLRKIAHLLPIRSLSSLQCHRQSWDRFMFHSQSLNHWLQCFNGWINGVARGAIN